MEKHVSIFDEDEVLDEDFSIDSPISPSVSSTISSPVKPTISPPVSSTINSPVKPTISPSVSSTISSPGNPSVSPSMSSPVNHTVGSSVVTKDWNNWWKFLLWLLLFLFFWILIWYLLWKNDIGKEINNNGNHINKEKIITDDNKWIVSEKDIDKYRNNDNNEITPIWDINNDGDNDYIIISNEKVNDSIIDNYIIPIPIQPEIDINCLDSKYTNTWFKSNINYTDEVNKFVLNNIDSEVTVAIIDSWISEHKQFKKNIIDTDININQDTDWHWTSVAGVINIINSNVKLLGIKASNTEWKFSSIDIIKWLNEAIEKDVDIINLSFWWFYSKDKIIEWLINKANKQGIIVVAAAWNNGLNVNWFYPATYDWILTVWSSWPEYKISEFSNHWKKIDLLSPWECIHTTDLNNKYTKINWTSFSSPMLAWILSLYIDKYDSVDNIFDKLLETSSTYNWYLVPNVEKFLWLNRDEIVCNTKDSEELKKTIDLKNKELKKKTNEIEKIKKLLLLKKNFNNFINLTDNDNLEKNFNNFKSNNTFLEDEIIKEEKKTDNKLNTIYNSLVTLFWRDTTYLSAGQSLWIEVNDKDMSIVIPSDSVFPIKKTKIYLTRNTMQKKMEFKVYQWNNKLTLDNEYLWEFIIPNLIQIKDIWERVKVTFDIEKDWKISFIAQDIKYPNNKINGYLDTEKDILINSNNNLDTILNKFKEIDDGIGSIINNI